MKVLLCFLLLVITAGVVLADFEYCSDVADCSDDFKSKCETLAQELADDDRRLHVTCKNGICMCELAFSSTISRRNLAEETQTTKLLEADATTSDDPSNVDEE